MLNIISSYSRIFFLYHVCSCAVSNLKKCSLELGGKSPLIIFSDCDMDRAVRQVRIHCTIIIAFHCLSIGKQRYMYETNIYIWRAGKIFQDKRNCQLKAWKSSVLYQLNYQTNLELVMLWVCINVKMETIWIWMNE